MPAITSLLAEAIMTNLLEGKDADEAPGQKPEQRPAQRRRAESAASNGAANTRSRSPECRAVDPASEPASDLASNPDASVRQLQQLILRMKAAMGDPANVDGAYKEFSRIKEQCASLCRALVLRQLQKLVEAVKGTEAYRQLITSPLGPFFEERSAVTGRTLAEVFSGPPTAADAGTAALLDETWISAVREWQVCLQELAETIRAFLTEMYESYEPGATPAMVAALFADRSRSQVVSQSHTRSASLPGVLPVQSDFVSCPWLPAKIENENLTVAFSSTLTGYGSATTSG